MKNTETLDVLSIIADPEVQPRARLSEAAIMEYGEAMLAGDEFPPVVVFQDEEQWWLASGFLRLAATKAAGIKGIEAETATGGKREATFYSCAMNGRHGLRRTNEDKRRSVLKLLIDEEWQQWSDREIASNARVSPGLVGTMRAELGICSNAQIESADGKRRVQRGAQVYDMRMPNTKDRPRHDPGRWALVHLYDDVDNLYEHTVRAGVQPDQLLEYLNPEREVRLRERLFECMRWLAAMDARLAGRALEAAQ